MGMVSYTCEEMASIVGCRLRFSEVINQVGRIAKGTLY